MRSIRSLKRSCMTLPLVALASERCDWSKVRITVIRTIYLEAFANFFYRVEDNKLTFSDWITIFLFLLMNLVSHFRVAEFKPEKSQ